MYNSVKQLRQKTLRDRNFVDTGWLLARPIPIDRSQQGLSIGAGSVKIEPVLTKLWFLKDNHANNQGWNPSKSWSKFW